MILFLYLSLYNFYICHVANAEKTNVYIGALVPKINGYHQHDEFCFKSAINVATRLINDDENILQDYKLVVEYGDTGGKVGRTLEKLYQMIYGDGPTKIAMIGPGYSATAQVTAEMCTVKTLLQMSYSAMLPSLANKNVYPFFFRTTQSAESLSKAKVALLKLFSWKHVSLIYDYTNVLYYQSIENLSKLLTLHNITTLSISGFSSRFGDEIHPQIDHIQQLDSRIIIGAFGNFGARKIFCEVYKRKLYGPKYVWILMSNLEHDWYIDQYTSDDDTNCTVTEILTAAEGHLTAVKSNFRKDLNKTCASKKTAAEIWELVKAEKRALNPNLVISDDSPLFYKDAMLAFDAVWAVAKVLHQISVPPVNFNLTQFRYGSFRVSLYLATLMERLKFQGASGPISFCSKTRERQGEVLYEQLRNGTYIEMGHTDTATGEVYLEVTKIKEMFPYGVPRDKATIKREAKLYNLGVVGGLWTAAVLGIILAVGFLGFNIKYRKVKVIKMSSPRINNVISFGCILCYVSVILYGVDTRFIEAEKIPYTCNIISIFLALGFTLSFGGLFSKTYRVYRIFTATKTLKRVLIKDFHLIGVLLVLILIDVIIFVVWMFLSPFQLTTKELDRIENIAHDVITIPYLHQCDCNHQPYFTATLYVYKGLLLLFGLFLAWETRDVSVPAMNDSKYIGMAVYNVCVLSAVGVVCATALSNTTSQEAGYIIVSICVCLSTTVTLLLLLIPKIRMLTSKEDLTTSFTTTRDTRTVETNVKHNRRHKASVVSMNETREKRKIPYYLGDNQETNGYDTTSTNTIVSDADGNIWMGPVHENQEE